MSRSAPGLAACKAACGPAVVRQLRPWRAASGWRTRPPTSGSASTAGATSGEVFPHVITAPHRHADRRRGAARPDRALRRHGRDPAPRGRRARRWPPGVFGGYLYMNVSAMRLFGVRMPGMTPTDGRGAGDRHRSRSCRPTGGRRATGTSPPPSPSPSMSVTPAPPPRPRRPRRRPARRRGVGRHDARPRATASDDELLAWIRTVPAAARGEHAAAARGEHARRRAASASSSSSSSRRGGATPGLVNRIVAGTGDVDSAQPARRLWALGRLVAGDPDAHRRVRRRSRRHRRAHRRHRARGRDRRPSSATTAIAATTSTSSPRPRG